MSESNTTHKHEHKAEPTDEEPKVETAAVTEVKEETPVTTATNPTTVSGETKSGSNRTLMIIIAAVFFVCLICAACVGAIVLISDSDQDKRDEEKTENKKDDRKKTTDSDLEEYDGDEFSFEYPENWILEATSLITIIYSKDPKGIKTGDFNDNVNVVTTIGEFGDMSEENCEDFGNQLLNSYETIFETSELATSSIEEINDREVCYLDFNQTPGGISLNQEQYVFEEDNKVYTITVTLSDESEEENNAQIIVDSFEVK